MLVHGLELVLGTNVVCFLPAGHHRENLRRLFFNFRRLCLISVVEVALMFASKKCIAKQNKRALPWIKHQ